MKPPPGARAARAFAERGVDCQRHGYSRSRTDLSIPRASTAGGTTLVLVDARRGTRRRLPSEWLTAAVGTALVPSAGARPFGVLSRSCPENELTEIGLGRPSVRTAGPAAHPLWSICRERGWPTDGLMSPILVRNLGAPRRRGGVPGCSAPAFGGRLPRVGLPGRLVSRETWGEKREIVTSDNAAVEIPIGGQHRIMSLVGGG